MSPHQYFSHVLFVDDVLLFGGNTVEEWTCFRDILVLFCSATGMEISSTKSNLIAPGGIIDDGIRDIFPCSVTALDDGFKYLGYTLKPDKYQKKDWLWLWERLDRKMGLWCYRFLSLRGRLILAKAVLESIPVFWLSLFKIPISILEGLRRRITSFLWSGSGRDDKIHLVHWRFLARPKYFGG